MRGCMANFINDMRIDTIKHSCGDLLSALDDDSKNRNGNDQPDNRVSERVAKPYAKHTDEHCQAGPAVDPCVITVGDQRRAADPASNANAENSDRFVAKKTNA